MVYVTKDNSNSVRILKKHSENVKNEYSSAAKGLNTKIALFDKIKKMALLELKGIFLAKELHAIIDNENGTMIDERYLGSKRMVLYSLEDGFELDGLAERWGTSFEAVKEKINSLSDYAFLILHEEIYLFWNEAPAYGSPTPDLKKFIQKFASHDGTSNE